MPFSRARVCAMSQADCIRISVSILTPNAFSMRRAIRPERSALALRRLDSVGRETFNTLAAAVTDRPRGSMISVFMNDPGWGRVQHGHNSLLVVILKVQVADFLGVAIDPKREPPNLRDVQAPCALSVAGQAMRFQMGCSQVRPLQSCPVRRPASCAAYLRPQRAIPWRCPPDRALSVPCGEIALFSLIECGL